MAAAGVCACIDRGDIRKRLAEARTAVAAYEQQIRGVRQEEQETGKTLPYTPERYALMQADVQEAIQAAVLEGHPRRIPTLAEGETDAGCRTELKYPAISLVFKRSMQDGYSVHFWLDRQRLS